ncbi:MAG: beta-N-acetylhexosaminidase [Bdellovibrionota bacterium]
MTASNQSKALQSLKKNIGQLLMMGLESTQLNPQEKQTLEQCNIGGVIYFKRNIENPDQIRSLSDQIYRHTQDLPLIAIDQEGGIVTRLHEPFTVFPGNSYLGNCYKNNKNAQLAASQAQAMAKELKAVGINLNFTPVVDVHSNPKNPVIGPRAFDSDPKNVSTLAKITIAQYKKEKVICCAKHFPGHGDTDLDSHFDLPTITATKKVLWDRELVPFRASIATAVPTIMTAHIMFPALDKKYPATLSKKILEGLLRQELGYKGVIISDDLEMKAIAKHMPISEAAVMAFAAGVDLALVCKSLGELQASFEALIKAAEKGKLTQERLSQALRRVRSLKRRYLNRMAFEKLKRPTKYAWATHKRLAEKIKSLGA